MGLPLVHGKGLGLVRGLPSSPSGHGRLRREFERIFKIVFSTAGKNLFMGPSPWRPEGVARRSPRKNDPRLMDGYIKAVIDTQLVPCELERLQDRSCQERHRPSQTAS